MDDNKELPPLRVELPDHNTSRETGEGIHPVGDAQDILGKGPKISRRGFLGMLGAVAATIGLGKKAESAISAPTSPEPPTDDKKLDPATTQPRFPSQDETGKAESQLPSSKRVFSQPNTGENLGNYPPKK